MRTETPTSREMETDPQLPDSTCSKGLTPLHYAALARHSGMVQFFLDHGADPNSLSNYDETPLHLALSRSPRGTKYSDDWMENDWRVEGLLDFIDLEDHDTYEAAHNQVVEHRIATIDALLSHQKTHVNIQDIKGASALHHIRYEERVCALIVSKLIKKGADVFACDLQRRTALHIAV